MHGRCYDVRCVWLQKRRERKIQTGPKRLTGNIRSNLHWPRKVQLTGAKILKIHTPALMCSPATTSQSLRIHSALACDQIISRRHFHFHHDDHRPRCVALLSIRRARQIFVNFFFREKNNSAIIITSTGLVVTTRNVNDYAATVEMDGWMDGPTDRRTAKVQGGSNVHVNYWPAKFHLGGDFKIIGSCLLCLLSSLRRSTATT